jgi:superfamily II DNA or RNA helicase
LLAPTNLNVPIKAVDIIGAGKHKPNFRIDIAMMQSLVKKDVVEEIVSQYGQVIVDECHHISAFSFEQVLKQVKAKYILRLTANRLSW